MSIRDDLKAFLDGELSPERAAEVALAVEKDPELQSELTFMKDTSQQIKAMAKESSLGDARKVIDGLRPKQRPWHNPRWMRNAGLAAVLAFVGLVGLPLVMSSMQSRQSEDAIPVATRSMASEMKAGSAGAGSEEPPGNADAAEFAPGADMQERSTSGDYAAEPKASSSGSKVFGEGLNLGPRLVIRNGSLGLRVPDVRRTVDDAIQLVAAMGGYSENTSFTEVDGNPRATMTFRVPATKFDALLTSLHGMGEITSETLTGDDVTLQVADVEARVKTLRIEEEQYRIMLKSARRVGEILEIKQRIANVRMEIESLDAQRKALRSMAAMSTLTLTLDQKLKDEDPKPDDWFEETTIRATNLLKVIGQLVGQALTFLVILAPIWLPIAGFAWWAKRRKAA